MQQHGFTFQTTGWSKEPAQKNTFCTFLCMRTSKAGKTMNHGSSQTENYPGGIVTGTEHERATGRVNDALNLDVDDSCVGVLTCMLCVAFCI